MLSLSRKTDYALVALAHLARVGGGAVEKTVSARVIADAYHLPRAMLMNLLKQLHRRGVVGSTRGANGGYYLKRPPEQITVGQVVDAVEGPVQMAMCCPSDEAEPCTACQVYDRCPISGSIRSMSQRFEAMLHAVTLANLIEGEVVPAMRRALADDEQNRAADHSLAVVTKVRREV